MHLKTPSFWYRKPSLESAFLSPAALLYNAGRLVREFVTIPYKSSVPIICIGNLTAGGGGKTPTAIAVASLLKDKNPFFLSRGYGGCLRGPVRVDPQIHTHRDTGDEPLLLARHAPVIVSKNRAKGAQLAAERGAGTIIMDDGLQNPSVTKTLNLVVIDGMTGFGNQRMIPAGPLREPLKTGLTKADAFILIGDDEKNILRLLPSDKKIFRSRLETSANWMPPEKACIAFCGIAHPQKFRKTVEDKNIKLVGWHEFPDHYNYTPQDLRRLTQEASVKNTMLLTTEKDAVRIPPTIPVHTLPVEIIWDDSEKIRHFIHRSLNS